MATQPDTMPDTIDPQSPSEAPFPDSPSESPGTDLPGIVPPEPGYNQPDAAPIETPTLPQ